jgi:hypothetical protein
MDLPCTHLLLLVLLLLLLVTRLLLAALLAAAVLRRAFLSFVSISKGVADVRWPFACVIHQQIPEA